MKAARARPIHRSSVPVPNGPILHYMADQRRMDRGELVLIDAAAECDEYSSDITRTVPVDGKFTPRQREVYEVVLGAQKAAIAAVKPGAWLGGDAGNRSPKSRAITWMRTARISMANRWASISPTISGIRWACRCTIHARERAARSGHGDHHRARRLHSSEEKLGIRIEDVVLVTANGAKVLSAALPKEPDEIEEAVSK